MHPPNVRFPRYRKLNPRAIFVWSLCVGLPVGLFFTGDVPLVLLGLWEATQLAAFFAGSELFLP